MENINVFICISAETKIISKFVFKSILKIKLVTFMTPRNKERKKIIKAVRWKINFGRNF